MGRSRWAVVAVAVVFLSPVARSQILTPGPKRAAQQMVSNPVLDRAEALLAGRRWQTAHDLIVPWLKSRPKAPDRDRGIFLLAEVYFQSGDRVRSFYHLDELLDNYPESRLFYPAMELQYEIADSYLKGFKNELFGLRILGAEDEAIEMLFRIQERSPGSPLAEKALRRTADYYFATSQFDLAANAYGAFVRSYPRSPDIPQVKLRQAFASLAQFRGPNFDATPLIDARAQFKDVQIRYPDLAAEANVGQWIDKIDADLARKAYQAGDYYRRTDHPRGAVYYYRYVIQTYPNTKEAALARRDLARMPAWAIRQTPQPAANSDEATTRPGAEPQLRR
jgi:outer membrane assembly lipoprotein YfiO